MSNIKKAKETKDPMEAVLKNIEKIMGNANGKPSFSRFGNLEVEEISVIPFGVKAIDEASYCGGVPRGRIVELFGPESSGKSLLSLKLIAEAQKLGLEAALLDIEQSFDPEWAKKQGPQDWTEEQLPLINEKVPITWTMERNKQDDNKNRNSSNI